MPVVELCPKTGISEQTFYRWDRQFAGIGVAEVQRLLGDKNKSFMSRLIALMLGKRLCESAVMLAGVQKIESRLL